ncbi:MAG: hypothetical protein LBJ69_02060 [Holosporales bacterium]|nr:hypothetical protein [Holosporales bacterium]
MVGRLVKLVMGIAVMGGYCIGYVNSADASRPKSATPPPKSDKKDPSPDEEKKAEKAVRDMFGELRALAAQDDRGLRALIVKYMDLRGIAQRLGGDPENPELIEALTLYIVGQFDTWVRPYIGQYKLQYVRVIKRIGPAWKVQASFEGSGDPVKMEMLITGECKLAETMTASVHLIGAVGTRAQAKYKAAGIAREDTDGHTKALIPLLNELRGGQQQLGGKGGDGK